MYEDDPDMHAMWCEATEHTQAYDDAAVLRMLAEVAELRKDRARLRAALENIRLNVENDPFLDRTKRLMCVAVIDAALGESA